MSNNMKLVHWPLMMGRLSLLHLVQRGGTGRGHRYQSQLLHSGPLLCGFNVSVKGLKQQRNTGS